MNLSEYKRKATEAALEFEQVLLQIDKVYEDVCFHRINPSHQFLNYHDGYREAANRALTALEQMARGVDCPDDALKDDLKIVEKQANGFFLHPDGALVNGGYFFTQLTDARNALAKVRPKIFGLKLDTQPTVTVSPNMSNGEIFEGEVVSDAKPNYSSALTQKNTAISGYAAQEQKPRPQIPRGVMEKLTIGMQLIRSNPTAFRMLDTALKQRSKTDAEAKQVYVDAGLALFTDPDYPDHRNSSFRDDPFDIYSIEKIVKDLITRMPPVQPRQSVDEPRQWQADERAIPARGRY